MSATSEEPTRPFTDPDKELARRKQDTVQCASPTSRELSTIRITSSEVAERQKPQKTQISTQDAKDGGTSAAIWPDATQWHYMKLAFSDASKHQLPEARIILSHAPGPQELSPPDLSTAVGLPYTIEGWKMVGVVQRTQDVDFSFSIPFLNQHAASPGPSQSVLKCRILYHPANDSCVLFNMGSEDIHIGDIEARQQQDVPPRHFAVIHPGYWRVSVAVRDKMNDLVKCLADLLLVQRRFHVSLQDVQQRPESGKRSAPCDSSQSLEKKPKLVQDETEVIIEPQETTKTPSKSWKKPVSGPGIAVLDLQDGQTAHIQSTVSGERQRGHGHGTSGLDPYELTRIDGIARNPSTTVFTCRHSSIDAPGVVAKVLRYKDLLDGWKLASCARAWSRETQLLKKLNHRNIVSLCGMDGRSFAIYLELLPRSLVRGVQCNLSRAENFVILSDISSALAYIAEKGIYHNDIKPGNIAFSRSRGGVLLDFGLATEDKEWTSGGTPWYLPRDYYDNKSVSGGANDVWALGITFLYTLGIIPFPDTPENVWSLGSARLKYHPEHKKMTAWMEKIDHVRKTKLDRGDIVHSLVYDMLESDGNQRLTAAAIHKRLNQVAS